MAQLTVFFTLKMLHQHTVALTSAILAQCHYIGMVLIKDVVLDKITAAPVCPVYIFSCGMCQDTLTDSDF